MRTFAAGPGHEQLRFAVCSALTDHTAAASYSTNRITDIVKAVLVLHHAASA